MNKEQQELLDEVYENFEKWYNEHSGKEDYTGYYVPYKEEFIRLIKTDNDFSEEWGLKIEERELSLEERKQIVKNKYFQEFYWKIVDDDNDVVTIFEMDKRNIPTKLITVTYNGNTIESYE